MKNIFVHISRGLAYITFPAGVFLTANFLFSLQVYSLFDLSIGDVLFDVSGIAIFIASMATILFLHPQKASDANVVPRATRTLGGKIVFYLPHILILIFLATIGCTLLLLFFYFMASVFGG